MTCTHQGGALQVHTFEQNAWRARCLCCGDAVPAQPHASPAAGEAAATGFLRRSQGRHEDAAAAFRHAAALSGDNRYLFAALICRLGVIWCGNELQPTFAGSLLPMEPLTASPEWQALELAAGSLPPRTLQGMADVLAQLETTLSPLRANEGRRACDVFLCYRREPASQHSALRLHRELTGQGLLVFCADVTTRGKTQEQFESEIYHALRTAEHFVLFPGVSGLVTPWMRNELERTVCDDEHRSVCTDGVNALPVAWGKGRTHADIRTALSRLPDACTADALWERAIRALTASDPAAFTLLQRASAKGSIPARLLTASLFAEGLVLPRDEARARHWRALAGAASDAQLQQVSRAMDALEHTLYPGRRAPLLYVAADVSAASLAASRRLLSELTAALRAERRLAGTDLCLIGFDRHACILAEPGPLMEHGVPGQTAGLLHTNRRDGQEGCAYAAKGLHLAADHLMQHPSVGKTPLLLLISPRPTSDSAAALAAAAIAASTHFANDQLTMLCSSEQLPECIGKLLRALG